MSRTVFYSWQSDRPNKNGRNLIEKALEIAVAKIATDTTVEDAPRVDKDTKDVPGSPPIFDTILRKIDRASVFVADLTICGTRCGGRPTPNPNVLIEYGWALKSLGHFQVLTVMNEAYGAPSDASMPFDLAHLRFPITYNLAPDSTDEMRQQQKEELAKQFARALGAIFQSDEFRSKQPKEPEPIPFTRKQPLEGRARFRKRLQPLGFSRDHLSTMVGTPKAYEKFLADGPAMWMRMMPVHDPGRIWRTQELREKGLMLASIPFMSAPGAFSIHGEDGFGMCPSSPDEKPKAVCYLFDTGEVWIISVSLDAGNSYFMLDEDAFSVSLRICANVLHNLGCRRPFDWIVGMEGLRGRSLVVQRPMARTIGVCITDIVEETGSYNDSDNPSKLLRGFFETVFDKCGGQRPKRPTDD